MYYQRHPFPTSCGAAILGYWKQNGMYDRVTPEDRRNGEEALKTYVAAPSPIGLILLNNVQKTIWHDLLVRYNFHPIVDGEFNYEHTLTLYMHINPQNKARQKEYNNAGMGKEALKMRWVDEIGNR